MLHIIVSMMFEAVLFVNGAILLMLALSDEIFKDTFVSFWTLFNFAFLLEIQENEN